jgi:hypothetical protein
MANPPTTSTQITGVNNATNSLNAAMSRNSFLTPYAPYALKFPLVDFPNYCIQFRFGKYSKPSAISSGNIIPNYTIRLPIPKNLVDTFSQNYSEENLGPIIGGLAESGQQILEGNITSAIGNLQGAITGGAAAAVGGAAGLAAAAGFGDIVQQSKNAASALSGSLFNPFQTVLYKNPIFKKFTFDWLLTPKNKSETEALKNIITKIQYHTSPNYSRTFGSAVMDYPDIVEPELLTSENPANYLFKFKKCVVTSFSVNYVASGTPSFFKDTKAPTTVKITMQLQEIEIWTKESLQP